MGKRYQVWHGFGITQFADRQRAIDYAYENEGILIDTWANGMIPLPKATRVEYWVESTEFWMNVDPQEATRLKSEGFTIKVSPR